MKSQQEQTAEKIAEAMDLFFDAASLDGEVPTAALLAGMHSAICNTMVAFYGPLVAAQAMRNAAQNVEAFHSDPMQALAA